MRAYLYLIVFILGFPHLLLGQSEYRILKTINSIREEGCRCGGKKMLPVKPLIWNEQLEHSADRYAKHLKRHNWFSHYSKDGKDIGERIDDIGYNWQIVGENIAEGQQNFNEVMEDWMESPSHCEMIMNPNVTEMGLARVGKYWVQHFAKPQEQPYVDSKKRNN